MRATSLCLAALGLASSVAIAAAQAPSAGSAAAPSAELQSQDSGYVLKVKTRLVTIDIVATDSRGNMVRDLKPSDLRVFTGRNVPQTIAHFELKGSAGASPSLAAPSLAGGAKPPPVYSNQVAFEHLKIAPTVILLDALNTTLGNQITARAGMLRMLKTLPPDTPVAVFLLSHRLHRVEGLTSDPNLLRAALNQLTEANSLQLDASDDPSAVSAEGQTPNSNEYTDPERIPSPQDQLEVTAELEDFMKEEYARTIDLRASLTLETLTSIARSLSGIPGRKNLVWVSESFPLSIAPDPDLRGNTFSGMRSHAGRVQAAADALSDAQVTVYPVDARGLESIKTFNASEGFSKQSSFNAKLGNDQAARWDSQAGSVRYRGELSPQEGASEFFAYAFGGRFRCQQGSLVPINAGSGEPRLQMTFRDNQGRSAIIDLKGTEPLYSGDLPVGAGAKDFFVQVWKLAHCLSN